MAVLNSIPEDVIKIFVSMVVGAIIGAEREYKSKNAGFRTNTLITIGATLFTLLSREVSGGADFHIVGNIVVGVGFLGAGAIFKEGANISGLTTAATIWVSAAIGMAIGIGAYVFAFITLVTVLIILLGFAGIQAVIDNRNTEKYYKINIDNHHDINSIIVDLIGECGLNSKQVNMRKQDNKFYYTFKIAGSLAKHEKFLSLLSSSKEILSFEV